MNNRVIIAAIATAAAAGSAFADSVDVKFVGTGQGRSIKFDLNGQRQNVFAGQLKHNFSNGDGVGAELNGDILTYCTDLLERVSGSTNRFDVVEVETAPGTPMGIERANALRDIYVYAGGAQNASNANRDFTAAFQIAVWEIVSDFNGMLGRSSLDVESGAFEAYRTDGSTLSSAIRGHLSDLFDAIGTMGARSDGMGLYAVVNDGKQDQLVEMRMVPLPSAAGLGFAGLLGVSGFRRRR